MTSLKTYCHEILACLSPFRCIHASMAFPYPYINTFYCRSIQLTAFQVKNYCDVAKQSWHNHSRDCAEWQGIAGVNAFWRYWPRLKVQDHNGPEALIIWKNFLSQLFSRTIFEMHTAPGACLLYASGAVCCQIWSWSIFHLENSSWLSRGVQKL